MTPNDTQMDVLMRRYAKHGAERGAGPEHLDPDELNAFAEGTLPLAARSRYVSHLADCGDCRKLASQLALASGAAAHAQVPVSESVAERSWRQKLGLVLTPPALRYAAFTLVLVIVASVGVIVWRQPRQANSDLIAKNEPNPNQTSAVKPAAATEPVSNQNTEALSPERSALAQATPSSNVDAKGADVTTVNPPPPPKPESEIAETAKPTVAASRPMEQPRSESPPSYAPPPPGESRADNRSREQQNTRGITSGGPRRNESYEKHKAVDRVGYSDVAKSRSGEEDGGRATANQPKTGETKQEVADQRARDEATTPAPATRPTDDNRTLARKRDATADAKDKESAQTRSVGGRKFRRQNNAWVDVKFKPSMSLKDVARSSDDFAELDSGLRSIAQQLGGEVVVVWKGKAYRIR